MCGPTRRSPVGVFFTVNHINGPSWWSGGEKSSRPDPEAGTNMSADPHTFPSPCSQGFGAVDPRSSPLSEMETLRMLVSERLTAAVDDILGVFVKTVARYREQIDRQRRQLDSLKSEEDKWIRTAGRFVSSLPVLGCN